MVVDSNYLEDIVDIDDSVVNGIALDSNGFVWTWAENANGQLGNDDSPNDSSTPVKVHDGEMNTQSGYLEDIVSVEFGYNSAYALDSNGYLWAWGDNPYGELGNDSTTNSDTPVKVHDGDMGTQSGYLENIVAISADGIHALALDSSGNVWAWGANLLTGGALGDGTTTNRHTPIKVEDNAGTGYLTNIVHISTGYHNSFAIESNDDVWSWGANTSGKLGIGNSSNQNLPQEML